MNTPEWAVRAAEEIRQGVYTELGLEPNMTLTDGERNGVLNNAAIIAKHAPRNMGDLWWLGGNPTDRLKELQQVRELVEAAREAEQNFNWERNNGSKLSDFVHEETISRLRRALEPFDEVRNGTRNPNGQ